MGTWGPGLYSDDLALDIRDEYKGLLGDGVPEPEATRQLLAQWQDTLLDAEIAPVFWLVLADTQWNVGQLQDHVKNKALEVIALRSDLERWMPYPELVNKRITVLERLRQKLAAPPPPAKKIRKRFVDSTDWELGDVYSFQLLSGQFVLLHVLGFHQDRGGRAPVCDVLDWTGTTIPGRIEIEKLTYKSGPGPFYPSQFLLGAYGSKKNLPVQRLNLVAKGIQPKQTLGGYGIIFWRKVDREMEFLFGFR